jgi:hypothetical protein
VWPHDSSILFIVAYRALLQDRVNKAATKVAEDTTSKLIEQIATVCFLTHTHTHTHTDTQTHTHTHTHSHWRTESHLAQDVAGMDGAWDFVIDRKGLAEADTVTATHDGQHADSDLDGKSESLSKEDNQQHELRPRKAHGHGDKRKANGAHDGIDGQVHVPAAPSDDVGKNDGDGAQELEVQLSQTSSQPKTSRIPRRARQGSKTVTPAGPETKLKVTENDSDDDNEVQLSQAMLSQESAGSRRTCSVRSTPSIQQAPSEDLEPLTPRRSRQQAMRDRSAHKQTSSSSAKSQGRKSGADAEHVEDAPAQSMDVDSSDLGRRFVCACEPVCASTCVCACLSRWLIFRSQPNTPRRATRAKRTRPE